MPGVDAWQGLLYLFLYNPISFVGAKRGVYGG